MVLCAVNWFLFSGARNSSASFLASLSVRHMSSTGARRCVLSFRTIWPLSWASSRYLTYQEPEALKTWPCCFIAYLPRLELSASERAITPGLPNSELLENQWIASAPRSLGLSHGGWGVNNQPLPLTLD